VLTAVTSASEVIVIYLQVILFANTAAFFCSLLGVVHFKIFFKNVRNMFVCQIYNRIKKIVDRFLANL